MYKQSAPESIQAMFASIAPNYDLANSTISFGLHRYWNQQLIHSIGFAKSLLDLCAGTGEIAFGYLKKNPEAEAILLDFCPEMLAVAQAKGVSFRNRFEIVQADAQAIPLSMSSVDAVSIAYGIRNVKEPEKCFHEVYRVLKPGGRFGILESTRPTSTLPRLGHRCYTRFVLPFLGKLTAKNIEAYKYLASSVEMFSTPSVLMHNLQTVGFKNIQSKPLCFGAATLLTATK